MELIRKIHKIASYYGLEAQSRQTMEECAELIQALNKYLRNVSGGQPTQEKDIKNLVMGVIEEIADVSIMLEEIKFLLHCDSEVSKIIESKVNRTFERDNNLTKADLLKEWANKLNGREYGAELTPEEEKQLQKQGLIVVFGASDDLCEFSGAISDEVDCYEGGTIHIDKNGLFHSCECEDTCIHAQEAKKQCKTITAKWCDSLYDWSYETDIPHEEFSIMEDGENYCKGIIFDINSL